MSVLSLVLIPGVSLVPGLSLRRNVVKGGTAALLHQHLASHLLPGLPPALAATPPSSVIAVGTVISNGFGPGSEGALYVTARPAPDNAALQAGKVPPLAAARFAPVAFPFQFELTSSDLTAEYLGTPSSAYEEKDLLISVRFDTDGVAATRGPDDLVGRASLVKRRSAAPVDWLPVVVELQGRGLTGRLLTGGK